MADDCHLLGSLSSFPRPRTSLQPSTQCVPSGQICWTDSQDPSRGAEGRRDNKNIGVGGGTEASPLHPTCSGQGEPHWSTLGGSCAAARVSPSGSILGDAALGSP